MRIFSRLLSTSSFGVDKIPGRKERKKKEWRVNYCRDHLAPPSADPDGDSIYTERCPVQMNILKTHFESVTGNGLVLGGKNGHRYAWGGGGGAGRCCWLAYDPSVQVSLKWHSIKALMAHQQKSLARNQSRKKSQSPKENSNKL